MTLEELVKSEIAARTFPGCVIGISLDGETQFLSYGSETYDADSPAVSHSSLYDLASVTKAITATLAHQLLDAGQISLDDRVRDHLPNFTRSEVRIIHLLTYTLGNRLPLATLAERTPEAIIDAVCSEKCDLPGYTFSYSNAPAFLLGLIIERVLKALFSDIAAERIFTPLGMRTATFTPMGAVPASEQVRDIPHDESARVFARKKRAVGHAGLFASAEDIVRFLEHIRANADHRHTSNHINGIGTTALGWELDQPWMGDSRTRKTFGKTGFTGTSVLIEPDSSLAVVILTNRTYPRRPHDASEIMRFRRRVHDIIHAWAERHRS